MTIRERIFGDSYSQEGSSNSMGLFKAELQDSAYNAISLSDEQSLWRQLNGTDKQTSEKARTRLAETHVGLVVSEAKKFRSSGKRLGLELSDLISEGTCGLMKAIDCFDPSKGVKLSTHATRWIDQALGRALDNGGIIRHPANKVTECRRLKKTEATLNQAYQRKPTVPEMAEVLGFTSEKAEMLLNLINQGDRQVASLDESPRSLETATSRTNFIVDKNANPDIDVLRKEALEKSLALFDKLPGQEKKVMKQVVALVLNGYKMGSVSSPIQPTIAKEMGVTRQRVDQIMKKALERLLTDPTLKEETAEVLELLRS